MCQQWFSVVGLCLDVIGFLTIAIEWHHGFVRDHEKRIDQLGRAYERAAAEARGEQVGDLDEDKLMWREFQKLFLQEWRWRGRVFYSGAILIVLGFLGQLLGSWPGGVPFFGFKAC
jgi:hypothetical protein